MALIPVQRKITYDLLMLYDSAKYHNEIADIQELSEIKRKYGIILSIS